MLLQRKHISPFQWRVSEGSLTAAPLQTASACRGCTGGRPGAFPGTRPGPCRAFQLLAWAPGPCHPATNTDTAPGHFFPRKKKELLELYPPVEKGKALCWWNLVVGVLEEQPSVDGTLPLHKDSHSSQLGEMVKTLQIQPAPRAGRHSHPTLLGVFGSCSKGFHNAFVFPPKNHRCWKTWSRHFPDIPREPTISDNSQEEPRLNKLDQKHLLRKIF